MPGDRLRIAVPAHPGGVRAARDRLREWLSGRAEADRVADAVLVLSELVTNAVQAAPGASLIGVGARVDDARLYLMVVNELAMLRVADGHVVPSMDIEDWDVLGSDEDHRVEMPVREAERGRGLPIVDSLVDWWVLRRDGEAVVRCRMDLGELP